MNGIEQLKQFIKELNFLKQKLEKAWKVSTMLIEYVRIFKEDQGMDRTKEDMLHRASDKFTEAKLLVDQTLCDVNKQIKEKSELLTKYEEILRQWKQK